MSIKWIKSGIIFFFMEAGIMTCIGQGEAYIVLYPEESIEAKAFYDEHKNLFETAAQELGLSSEFLFSIVAPELTQYSYLRNRLETYSLKVLYVQRGKSYADFSIGYFQMKPSFIERLETYLSLDTLLRSKYSSYLFTDPEARTSRVERIDRLNTVAWQIKYLSLFCEAVNRNFGKLAFSNEEEKLRFYASAYNCGFYKSEQQIKETEQKALFPHFSKQKFKYADISVLFYREIMNEK